MRRLITFFALAALLLAPFRAATGKTQEGDETHHRKFHFDFYSPDVRHEIPQKYLIHVPPTEKRKGLSEHLSLGIYSNFRSRYVSKELPCSKGPVWQPSATLEAYGFGLNVWSNFVLNDEPNQGEFNEVDFITYYNARIGNLTLHPYVMFMVYPNADPASLDYGAGPMVETDIYLQYDILMFNIFSLVRTRVKRTAGSVYAHVGAGYRHPFDCGITLEASALLSLGNDKFLNGQYGGDIGTNIDTVAGTLGASWTPWKGLSFKPNINAAIHVVPKIRKAISQNPDLKTYIVWGGLDLAYNF